MAPEQPRPSDWKQLHLWQIQPVRDALILVAALGLVYLGYVLSVVTVPLLLAMALAYLFEPLVRRLTRTGRIGRPLVAVGIVLVTGVVVVVPVTLGVGFAAVQGVKFASRVAQSTDALSFAIQHPDDEAARARLEASGRSWVEIHKYVVDQQRRAKEWEARQATPPAPNAAPLDEPSDSYRLVQWGISWVRENAGSIGKGVLDVGGGAIGATVGLVGSVGRFLFGAFLTAFFFFFCCTSWGGVLNFWEGLIPEQRRSRTIDLLSQMDRVIAGFVRGRLTICGVMIVVYTLGYSLIGLPAPLIIGPIIGVLTIVPYAAGAVGIPLAILLLWLEPHTGFRGEWWWIVGSPMVVTGVVQVLDDYVLTPRIQGQATKMDTPTILFASIAGGALAGFYGILLAIPAAACIKILLKEVFWPRFQAWSQGQARDILPIGKE